MFKTWPQLQYHEKMRHIDQVDHLSSNVVTGKQYCSGFEIERRVILSIESNQNHNRIREM